MKVKNRATKLKASQSKVNQELLPPEIHQSRIAGPKSLETVKDIREELARIYKLVFKGELMLADATRLAYYLDKMIQAIKTETDLDAISAAYAKAWGGVAIITDQSGDVLDV